MDLHIKFFNSFISFGLFTCISLYLWFFESSIDFEQTILNPDIENKMQFHMHYGGKNNDVMLYDLNGKVTIQTTNYLDQFKKPSTLFYIYNFLRTDKDIEVRIDTDNKIMVVKSTMRNSMLFFPISRLKPLYDNNNEYSDIFSMFVVNCKKIDEENKSYKNSQEDLKKLLTICWIYAVYDRNFKLYLTAKYIYFVYEKKILTFQIDVRDFFDKEIAQITDLEDNHVFLELCFNGMTCFFNFKKLLFEFDKINSTIVSNSEEEYNVNYFGNSFLAPFNAVTNMFLNKKIIFCITFSLLPENINLEKIFKNDFEVNILYLNEFKHDQILEKYKLDILKIVNEISDNIYHSFKFHCIKIYTFEHILI